MVGIQTRVQIWPIPMIQDLNSFYISQSAFQIIQTKIGRIFRKQRGSKIIWNKPYISEIVELLICYLETKLFSKRFGQFHPWKNAFENRNLKVSRSRNKIVEPQILPKKQTNEFVFLS